MELIKRKVISSEPKRLKIKAIGFNSNEVLTIVCNDGDDLLINLDGEDLHKLKKFLDRIILHRID